MKNALSFTLLLCAATTACAADMSGGQEAPARADEPTASSQSAYSTTPYTYALSWRGGQGGNGPVPLSCGSGNVVVGFYGRAASYIDQLGLVCAAMNQNGTLGPAWTTGALGGWGGDPFFWQCPAGWVVRATTGWSGQYLDNFEIVCGPAPTGSPNWTFAAGGNGVNWYWDGCPDGYDVTGFNVRYGSWIDGEQTICDYIQP
jgi:hypothetical protein